LKEADPVIRLNTGKVPPASPEKPAKGRVITFYSYKGGTGRSMALANVAWLLALNNQRVLAIDWDLEAPGLHRFFHPFIADKELRDTNGLVDFVADLAAQSATSGEESAAEEIDPIEYIRSLEWPRDSASQVTWDTFGERARIDLLPAGRQGPAYAGKLAAFNWIEFYERLGGRRLLDGVKRKLQSIYDYILIDSRTGVSDTSGICTVEMPDTLVVCFTLNNQSIFGAAAIAESVRSHRPQPEFRIFPVPTRVEVTSEQDKLQAGVELAQQTFSTYLEVSYEHSRYWGRVQMAYFPYYAFEEIPALFGDKPDQLLSLSTPIKQLTAVLTDEEISRMPPLGPNDQRSEENRREIVGWYQRRAQGAADIVQTAERFLDQIAPDTHDRMLSALGRLVQVGGNGVLAPRTALIEEFGDREGLVETLAKAGLVTIAEARGGRTVSFADASLVERWGALRGWLEINSKALRTRQALDVAMQTWLRADRVDGALLSGTLLTDAQALLSQILTVELTPEEREFVKRSAAAVVVTTHAAVPAAWIRLISGRWRLMWFNFRTKPMFRVGVIATLALALAGEYLFYSRERAARLENLLKEVVKSTDWNSVFAATDRKSVWIAGTHGRILHTGDAQHWAIEQSGTANPLQSIYGTPDGKSLWAVGGNGTILHSISGRQWQAQLSPTTSYLNAIHGTSDGKSLWVAGAQGTILAGDGDHWTLQKSPTRDDLLSVYAADRFRGQEAWVVGAQGTILQHRGERWQVQGGTETLYSIRGEVHNTNYLLTVGTNGAIFCSEDEGQHWLRQESGTQFALYSVYPAAVNSAWAVGQNGTILHTSDGEHWYVQRSSTGSNNVLSIDGDGKSLWAVGQNGTILHTADGSDWAPVDVKP
jgi:MinD-like ATPase involved in chromosome partitioning or flagellar assembly/photosystem II stability/assembly factor-like uncharacterized protein